MGGRKWRRASRQWRAVAGRLTAAKELVSCIWRRAPQIIWGGCQTYLEPNARTLPSPLYFLCHSLFLSLSLFLRIANGPGTGALLFLCFSLPFSPYFSCLLVSLSHSIQKEQGDQRMPALPPLMICDPLLPGNLETRGRKIWDSLGTNHRGKFLPTSFSRRTIKWRPRMPTMFKCHGCVATFSVFLYWYLRSEFKINSTFFTRLDNLSSSRILELKYFLLLRFYHLHEIGFEREVTDVRPLRWRWKFLRTLRLNIIQRYSFLRCAPSTPRSTAKSTVSIA